MLPGFPDPGNVGSEVFRIRVFGCLFTKECVPFLGSFVYHCSVLMSRKHVFPSQILCVCVYVCLLVFWPGTVTQLVPW